MFWPLLHYSFSVRCCLNVLFLYLLPGLMDGHGSGIGDAGKNMGTLAKGARVTVGKKWSAGASAAELAAWAKEYL